MVKTGRTETLERVAEMYERHPYPPVDDDIAAYQRGEAWLLESPNPSFHHYWPYQAYTDDLDILVAGCGTQQAAQIAAGLPNARIVATDISDNSLDQTRRLAKEIDARNLDLQKLAIEDVTSIGQKFDLVICTGVLHHLEDPDAGLKALGKVLHPSGSMHIMLYGKHGRTGVYMLQALFRALQIDPLKVTARDIAAIRGVIETLPKAHPFAAVRDVHPDWRDDEGLVDLLLHVQDRAYAIDEVYDFLAGANLKVQKLLFAARTDPAFVPLKEIAGKDFGKLPEARQRAAVELYRASIKKHIFIACHQSRPEAGYEIGPGRQNWTSVQAVITHGLEVARPNAERKSYRITWPYHAEPDIAVDTTDNGIQLLEMIDGNRTIEEAFLAAGFKKSDASLRRQLEAFLKKCARADFVTFKSRITSSD